MQGTIDHATAIGTAAKTVRRILNAAAAPCGMYFADRLDGLDDAQRNLRRVIRRAKRSDAAQDQRVSNAISNSYALCDELPAAQLFR